MTDKEKYREFCKKEKEIPIFSRDWWLDSVCTEGEWDVVLYEKGGQVWGSLPYYKIKKGPFRLITMPKLTQTMGVYIKYPQGQKYYTKLSWEHEIMKYLISKLPKVDYFTQNFHNNITNWLPFYWENFKQTTRYTYIIENITIEELEKNLEGDIRRRRRKAYSLGVEIEESDDIELFYRINAMTFARQNIYIPYSFEFVRNLYEKCKSYNAVKINFAKLHNEVIAATFLVFDENTVYLLMGGIDPKKKDIGAMDVLIFEGIVWALENGRRFDFEGSMIESKENYFRNFGAIQKTYFKIYKYNSTMLKLIMELIR